jgi:DNA topoisomerase-3
MVDANPKNRIIEHLAQEGKNATYLLLWLDNDREGENICFEIQDIVMPVMKKCDFKQIYRAIFSSLATPDLIQSFRNISKGPNRNESISVDARQIIDLKIGVVFSRFQSLYFGEKYAGLNGNKVRVSLKQDYIRSMSNPDSWVLRSKATGHRQFQTREVPRASA